MDKVYGSPDNVGESPQFGTMIKENNAQCGLVDNAYASRANRAA